MPREDIEDSCGAGSVGETMGNGWFYRVKLGANDVGLS